MIEAINTKAKLHLLWLDVRDGLQKPKNVIDFCIIAYFLAGMVLLCLVFNMWAGILFLVLGGLGLILGHIGGQQSERDKLRLTDEDLEKLKEL